MLPFEISALAKYKSGTIFVANGSFHKVSSLNIKESVEKPLAEDGTDPTEIGPLSVKIIISQAEKILSINLVFYVDILYP